MARKKLPKANPLFGAPFKCGDSSRLLRWCENPDSVLRRMGFADDVIRAEMGFRPRDMGEGWFLSPDNDTGELARGVVFRLSRGRGFVAGVALVDSRGRPVCGTDGAAMLAVCERPESSAEDAARYADQLAEWHAEAERDYQTAWRAGQDAAEHDREAREARAEIIQACADIRAARRSIKADGAEAEAIARLCGRLRRIVATALDDMAEARRKRDALRDEWRGNAGFAESYREGC